MAVLQLPTKSVQITPSSTEIDQNRCLSSVPSLVHISLMVPENDAVLFPTFV